MRLLVCLTIILGLVAVADSELGAQEPKKWGPTVHQPEKWQLTGDSIGVKYLGAETLRTNRIIVKNIDLIQFLNSLIDFLIKQEGYNKEDIEKLMKDATVEFVKQQEQKEMK